MPKLTDQNPLTEKEKQYQDEISAALIKIAQQIPGAKAELLARTKSIDSATSIIRLAEITHGLETQYAEMLEPWCSMCEREHIPRQQELSAYQLVKGEIIFREITTAEVSLAIKHEFMKEAACLGSFHALQETVRYLIAPENTSNENTAEAMRFAQAGTALHGTPAYLLLIKVYFHAMYTSAVGAPSDYLQFIHDNLYAAAALEETCKENYPYIYRNTEGKMQELFSLGHATYTFENCAAINAAFQSQLLASVKPQAPAPAILQEIARFKEKHTSVSTPPPLAMVS